MPIKAQQTKPKPVGKQHAPGNAEVLSPGDQRDISSQQRDTHADSVQRVSGNSRVDALVSQVHRGKKKPRA